MLTCSIFKKEAKFSLGFKLVGRNLSNCKFKFPNTFRALMEFKSEKRITLPQFLKLMGLDLRNESLQGKHLD